MLARYHRAYPAVNLHVQSAPSGELLEGLLTGRLDAALVDGPASQSYGLAVAQLAGVPAEVITRAREHLSRLETTSLPHLIGTVLT